MTYIDIIVTDEPDAIEITGTKDHQWVGLRDALDKPKISLFKLWTIKKFLERSYEKLNKEDNGSESDYVQSRIKGVDSYPKSVREFGTAGVRESGSGLVTDQGEGSDNGDQGEEEARTSV